MSPNISSSSSSSSSVTPISRVLIIDDNEDITELIKDYLETEDIECKIINRGIDGLDEIPDVVTRFTIKKDEIQ
jgi:CheY-like chemotaxis protein